MDMILMPIISFIVMSLLLMAAVLIIPNLIGRAMPPSFTNVKKRVFPYSKQELFQLLTDYENFPKWRGYLASVEVEQLDDKKLKITEHYKKKKYIQDFTEVRKVVDKSWSIVKVVVEYTALWTFELEEKSEYETLLTLKETMYVYHPYLRCMLRYVLRDENARHDMFRKIKGASKLIETNRNAQENIAQ